MPEQQYYNALERLTQLLDDAECEVRELGTPEAEARYNSVLRHVNIAFDALFAEHYPAKVRREQ